ncbi:MAG: CDP-alcohol phosphatidyltransferase family protein [Nanoarchaeota archaeon]
MTIILGFSVLLFSSEQHYVLASVMILLGGFFDQLDGMVARWTKTGNRFGYEFDLVADLIIYSVAPAILIFFMFSAYNTYYALVISLFPLIFGCIRLARFNVKKIEYPGYWIGLTRPGVALFIVAFLNSHLFTIYTSYLLGGVCILLVSILNISFIPYIGHHKRKFSLWQKAIFLLMLAILAIAIFFGLFWDVLFVYVILYLLSPAYLIPTKERVKIHRFIKKWKSEN